MVFASVLYDDNVKNLEGSWGDFSKTVSFTSGRNDETLSLPMIHDFVYVDFKGGAGTTW